MSNKNTGAGLWKKPVLIILGVAIVLSMLRLGIWQLGRADEKQQVLDEMIARSSETAVDLNMFTTKSSQTANSLRFRKVKMRGEFLQDKTIFVDRQVVQGRVGYQVFTPFRSSDGSVTAMIARGWVTVGDSRELLPEIETPRGELSLLGRLNVAPAQPPLWNGDYPVAQGRLWQYLPIDLYAEQMQLKLFPLVIELAPETKAPTALLIDWPEIDDQWVAKHQGYAFQWFAMALAFLIACIVLLIRSLAKN